MTTLVWRDSDVEDRLEAASPRASTSSSAPRATEQTLDPDKVGRYLHMLRGAVVLGAQATAARASKLEHKCHALFVRLRDRRGDYLRFVTDPTVPFDNNASERTIRMPKFRIKISGSMRTTTGAA